MLGYEINRFSPQPQPHLQCLTCKNVAREPHECNYCGQMYCLACVANKQQCTNTDCSAGGPPAYVPISGAMLKMYKNLQLYCQNPECKKLLAIADIESHQATCLKLKCSNFDLCQDYVSNDEQLKNLNVCSIICAITQELAENGTDFKLQYQTLKKFLPQLTNQVQQVAKPQILNLPSGYQNNDVVKFRWDRSKCGSGIQLTSNDMCVFLKESSYIFRTVLGDTPFEKGVHYWEIEADSRTENELKIGVCQGNNINLNAAFCDLSQGFAYYGLAQLRNGSNASGQTYGKRFKKEGTLGVCLNMINGTLSFSLNGEFMGIAFRSDYLKKGPIYAAVALLHCAGCTLRVGMPKPSYMD